MTVWLGAGGVVVAGVLSFATRGIDAPEMPIVRVVRKDLSAWIATNGKVEAIAPQVNVARLDSFVREVFVTEGAFATAGQPLLTLEAAELRAQLARTREDQLAAREQLRVATAGGNAEERAKLSADVKPSDAELPKLAPPGEFIPNVALYVQSEARLLEFAIAEYRAIARRG